MDAYAGAWRLALEHCTPAECARFACAGKKGRDVVRWLCTRIAYVYTDEPHERTWIGNDIARRALAARGRFSVCDLCEIWAQLQRLAVIPFEGAQLLQTIELPVWALRMREKEIHDAWLQRMWPVVHAELARRLVLQDIQLPDPLAHYEDILRWMKNPENITVMLEQVPDILHHCICLGQGDCLQLLLDARASLQTCDLTGATPLLVAARCGLEWDLHTLIRRGALPQARTYGGDTVLTLAVANGHHGIARALIRDYHINVHTRNYQGLTALMLTAAQVGPRALACMRLLVMGGAGIRDRTDGRTAVDVAREHGNTAALDELLRLEREGPQPRGERALIALGDALGPEANQQLLENSFRYNHADILRMILEHDYRSGLVQDLMMRAASENRSALIRALIAVGADVTDLRVIGPERLDTPLNHINEPGHKESLAVLGEFGIDARRAREIRVMEM